MRTSVAITASAVLGLSALATQAATIAKKPRVPHTAAAVKPATAPEAPPAEPAPAKVIEPDPAYYGHAGSGTKY